VLSPPTGLEGLVRRSDVHLRPDPARVVAQLFVAGEELSSGASRANPVMQRVLAMSDLQAEVLLSDVLVRFQDRHPHLKADLLEHFNQVGDRLGAHTDLPVGRRMLLGAYATSEYAVEAAALCNPSIVPHPDQTGMNAGELRFVLSLRAVGEGHISSIEFRTGVAGPAGYLRLDDPGPLVIGGKVRPSTYDRVSFGAVLGQNGANEIASLIFAALPPTFTGPELDAAIAGLHPQVVTRRNARDVIERIRVAANSNYTIDFPVTSDIGQRVIRPQGPTESHGMEDARFVRFVDDDGSVTYYATYTAFDGAHVAPQLIQTDDFVTFRISQLSGRAATNKGMALFPRRVRGQYVALSRWDRERNAITTSSDGRTWDDPVEVQAPQEPWELIQIGNCGSPIETAEGWLVFTHGVGPMRTYSLGAVLLDLDDPSTVRAKLTAPLLSPDLTERDGYVPNVVYTCGALLHQETIVLPYAHGDSETTMASIFLPDLLDLLLSG
jgi:predicted GH43/DUF377 family glycosyl hydrolase